MTRPSLIALFLAACGGSAEDTSADPSTGDNLTFYRDMTPIIDRYCLRCHDGAGLGSADFSDPAVVTALGEYMLQRIDAGEMPPPAADPACNPYENSDRLFMDPADRDAVAAWIDGGKVLGDPSEATTSAWPQSHLSATTHTLGIAAPYTPNFVDKNEYRCLILDWDEAEDLYITGFEPRIDNAAISHHTVLFAASDGDAESYVTDPATRSWPCSITPDNDWPNLHAWAPGNNPVEMPPGGGLRVPGGSQLVLQMHYYEASPEAAALQDSPGYYLNTQASVDTEIFYAPVGPDSFTIPAGDANHTETFAYTMRQILGGPATTTVYGVFPHMHVLGKSYDFKGITPEGDEKCIARADRYDFANQPTYWFEEPVALAPDDTLSIACTWDNSSANPDQLNTPPIDVDWGEDTNQEMCFALMYLSIN